MQNDLSKSIQTMWERLERSGLPIHSFLADHKGSLLLERYQEPYTSQDLHRMFSITKSFCSLAVGYLLEDGLIALDDRITRYFMEYCPAGGFHPWLEEMTIRHMLAMETCYSSTTYKINSNENWVASFFLTPPTHRSGQIFSYDTSSSHTLAALVKKRTGKGVLDYLREKLPAAVTISEDAYIIADPFGAEMGGSGLMARPSDLLSLGRYCMDTVTAGTGIFADYLREAVSFQTPTLHAGATVEEQQGYGYQFWRIRHGFAMYGMGGQYVLFYPELDLVLVLTADTQSLKGGNTKMLDIVFDALEPHLPSPAPETQKKAPLSWDASYQLADNPNGFSSLSLSYDDHGGLLCLQDSDTLFRIPFSFDQLSVSVLEKYQQRVAVRAVWADSHTLYLPVQIVDECVGSIHILLHLDQDKITFWMHKIEETYFHEFEGFFEGTVSPADSSCSSD